MVGGVVVDGTIAFHQPSFNWWGNVSEIKSNWCVLPENIGIWGFVKLMPSELLKYLVRVAVSE